MGENKVVKLDEKRHILTGDELMRQGIEAATVLFRACGYDVQEMAPHIPCKDGVGDTGEQCPYGGCDHGSGCGGCEDNQESCPDRLVGDKVTHNSGKSSHKSSGLHE